MQLSLEGCGLCLSSGFHVLHGYTRLKMSSSKVSVVVRNMLESAIFLKKGMQVARVVSASPVPPVELSPEMEAALGAEEDSKSYLWLSDRGNCWKS